MIRKGTHIQVNNDLTATNKVKELGLRLIKQTEKVKDNMHRDKIPERSVRQRHNYRLFILLLLLKLMQAVEDSAGLTGSWLSKTTKNAERYCRRRVRRRAEFVVGGVDEAVRRRRVDGGLLSKQTKRTRQQEAGRNLGGSLSCWLQ
jgi:hypothetical protein